MRAKIKENQPSASATKKYFVVYADSVAKSVLNRKSKNLNVLSIRLILNEFEY